MKNIASYLITIMLTIFTCNPLPAMNEAYLVERKHTSHAYYKDIQALCQSLEKNKNDPLEMLKTIERLCQTYDDQLTVNLLNKAIKQTGIPLDTIKNSVHETILHYACSPIAGQLSLNVILAAADNSSTKMILARNNYGSTALHRAALHYNSACAETLISAAQNLGILQKLISLKDQDGQTALDIAIHWCGRKDIIATLSGAYKDYSSTSESEDPKVWEESDFFDWWEHSIGPTEKPSNSSKETCLVQ